MSDKRDLNPPHGQPGINFPDTMVDLRSNRGKRFLGKRGWLKKEVDKQTHKGITPEAGVKDERRSGPKRKTPRERCSQTLRACAAALIQLLFVSCPNVRTPHYLTCLSIFSVTNARDVSPRRLVLGTIYGHFTERNGTQSFIDRRECSYYVGLCPPLSALPSAL